MATFDTDSKYTKFILTEDEIRQGMILNQYQKMFIQNLIAQSADAIIALRFDPTNPVEFGLTQADQQGQITALGYLLDCSKEAEAAVLQSTQSDTSTKES